MLMARSARFVKATLALPVEMQPALFVLMLSVSVPLGPALKVIDGVPWPAVMLPLAIDQVYVVPAGPAGTEAGWPAELATTLAGAVIVTVPLVPIVTVCAAVAVQPAFVVTATLYVVVEDCATVIVRVVAPLDHEYAAKPAPASRVKLTFGQVEVGPVIVTVGGAWIGTLVDELPPHEVPLMVMPSVTLPLGPALKVMAVVPWPAVMLPLAMVQA
jgi:hypothetical protein